MAPQIRTIFDPKDVVVWLKCKRCHNETTLKLGEGYRPPSPCPFCKLSWADLWDNQGQVPKHGTTFDSFIGALNTLASINEEDGAGLSIRLEIQEEPVA